MFIDVHCHLTDEAIRANLTKLIEDAKNSGIGIIVTSGLGYEDCLKALEISDYKMIFPSLGIMSYELEGYESVLNLIEKNAKKIVAIGEVGLDFHISVKSDKELQKRVFKEFITLSSDLDLPLIVHSRSAGRHALKILIECNAKNVIMHAFDGSSSHSLIGIEKGYFFSIPPSVVRSVQKQKLVSKLPLDNILLESDAPALSPVPGSTNVPSNVRISAEVVSKIKGISLKKVEEITTENAMRILRIRA